MEVLGLCSEVPARGCGRGLAKGLGGRGPEMAAEGLGCRQQEMAVQGLGCKKSGMAAAARKSRVVKSMQWHAVSSGSAVIKALGVFIHSS